MNVKLVSVTKSMIEEKELSAEELLVYIATVSNPSNQMNTETSDKLIGYLIKNKHWSPFDQVHLGIGVTTSKSIGIQILRHWSIKPQEFSQRYAEVVDIEPIEFRLQAQKNRQSSTEIIGSVFQTDQQEFYVDLDNQKSEDLSKWLHKVAKNLQETQNLYKEGLKLGVAKECARNILPMASSTTLYLSGSVRSWIHYLEQRTSEHAQREHQDVANRIKDIFKQQFPATAKALNL